MMVSCTLMIAHHLFQFLPSINCVQFLRVAHRNREVSTVVNKWVEPAVSASEEASECRFPFHKVLVILGQHPLLDFMGESRFG